MVTLPILLLPPQLFSLTARAARQNWTVQICLDEIEEKGAAQGTTHTRHPIIKVKPASFFPLQHNSPATTEAH
jgi:hypothetical protein